MRESSSLLPGPKLRRPIGVDGPFTGCSDGTGARREYKRVVTTAVQIRTVTYYVAQIEPTFSIALSLARCFINFFIIVVFNDREVIERRKWYRTNRREIMRDWC